jgi:hypothetical protein
VFVLCGCWLPLLHAGALTSLRKLYDGGTQPGIDWVQGSSSSSQPGVFAQLVYDAYTESSYDTVWRDYAWQLPLSWWFPLDFGKLNSSQTWDHEERVQVRAEGGLLDTLLRRSLGPDTAPAFSAGGVWCCSRCACGAPCKTPPAPHPLTRRARAGPAVCAV